mmetsp:Transcript_6160/g.18201  ORF Transcript_6160/g.18201 Transcript_6160/m.18201 type:complete len:252 (-) Transcript_6160:25-780(-)
MTSAFDDPSVHSAVNDLAAAEAFFDDAPAGGGFAPRIDNPFAPPPDTRSSLGSAPLPGAGEVPGAAFTSGTLDEPVSETLLRDARHVGRKLALVLRPFESQAATLRHLRDWDLWGPLAVSLALATLLAAGAPADQEGSVFSTVFGLMWAGALVVTVNAQLLGGQISLLQSVCVLGYSTFPVLAARGLIWVVEGLAGTFRSVRVLAAVLGLVWSTRASVLFISEVIGPQRRALAVVPVFMFYAALCWMVVVI